MSSAQDSSTSHVAERRLGAHNLGQYIIRARCERYLRLALCPSEADSLLARYKVKIEPLSPLLSESGRQFERDAVLRLAARARVCDLRNRSAADFICELKAQPEGPAFYDQPALEGRIGVTKAEGRADLIQIVRAADESVSATIIDIKATRRETVGFRLQVAFYARLLADALAEAGISVISIKGAIAARDSNFDDARFKTFDLDLYMDEIERLVAAPDSDVARAARASFETANYHLGPHCDGCPNNPLCFIDTAEREDLSLVPLLSASEKSALRIEGVKTARGLASLFQYQGNAMEIAPGRKPDVERIGLRWPLGSRLPALAQRARAALNRNDTACEARPYLLGADFGSLPDENQYPDLIKVFIDAQRDHIEDRIYLISSLVVGPRETVELVEMTPAMPDTKSEQELLVTWLQRVLPAIVRASDSSSAPLHVYLYDRRGQRALLDALARHFDALCAIPAFYDLLTATPALTQGMVSFLGEEVRARQNIGRICQNLYQVAQEMGFRWQDDSINFKNVFHARAFDSIRLFKRDPASGRFKPTRHKAGALWAEAAARFGTEIPLEYAYGAWGLLGQSAEGEDKPGPQLRDFLGVGPQDIRALGVHRCRALRHIEEKFRFKNKRVEKYPLDLSRLDQVEVDPADMPLHRSLEYFLRLEHHASLQERLLHFSLPPELRAQTGRSAVLRCESYEKQPGAGELATFVFSDAGGTPVARTDIGTLRIREGDWVILNPLVNENGARLTAWEIVRGRLAVIEKIGDTHISARLLPMTFKNSEFRYRHRFFPVTAGSVYTLDEMADDLNADKFLEACRNATSNHLYRWLSDPGEGKRPVAIRPSRLREAGEIAELAARSQAPRGLTGAQRRVVGDYLTDRVLVVQGPPGTGKSHTLGFAILARALALSTPARPFRVAVAAKTHAATLIALDSIARRAEDLLRTADPRVAQLASLKVAKICNDPGEQVPVGVERLLAEGSDDFSAAEQWAMLLAERLLVIGGTPGGIYKMVKQGAAKGRKIDWAREYFDLVVVDEASQMGIAEALTAAAFLREDGRFIAIGDHRQMPPILAHAWDQDSRRVLDHTRPHLSIFEYLRVLGFPSAALDQSFRIPAEVADFLHRYIYAEDGIGFHSDNRERLGSAAGLEGWLRAALDPDHALVIVEHDEAGSQRANYFEAGLVEDLARVATGSLGLDGERGIGIVVPHRAQKALLRGRLAAVADSIDTVERFQGGERDLVIVSATVSDREFALQESSFLLEPRRLTVAISRPRRKLVVIASRAVFDLIPADLDEYERAALWKYLRHECQARTLWEGEVGGHRLSVRAIGCKS